VKLHHRPLASSSAAAHAPASSTLGLLEARQLLDARKTFLGREQAVLDSFERRRGWESLGLTNLFAFLQVELRLSKGAAFYLQSAAELLQGFPQVHPCTLARSLVREF
jgi:hypothetical protein